MSHLISSHEPTVTQFPVIQLLSPNPLLSYSHGNGNSRAGSGARDDAAQCRVFSAGIAPPAHLRTTLPPNAGRHPRGIPFDGRRRARPTTPQR